jgi:hypothetical protein
MNEHTRAEEHLRVIRSLMERATVYRAISAPTAFIGGLLALATSLTIWLLDRTAATAGAPRFDARHFAEIWLINLAIVLAVNAFFLRQEALKKGRILLSPGARLTVRAVLPCLLIPAATTIWFFRNAEPIDEEIMVAVWIMFYGLCLLATALFAPRSLMILGWAFLLSGLVFMFWPKSFTSDPRNLAPDLAMGATFGLYHLIYAVAVWSKAPKTRATVLDVLVPE